MENSKIKQENKDILTKREKEAEEDRLKYKHLRINNELNHLNDIIGINMKIKQDEIKHYENMNKINNDFLLNQNKLNKDFINKQNELDYEHDIKQYDIKYEEYKDKKNYEIKNLELEHRKKSMENKYKYNFDKMKNEYKMKEMEKINEHNLNMEEYKRNKI